MDGTLMDSGEAHFVSWKAAFEANGHPFTREHWNVLFGRTANDFFDLVMPGSTSTERAAVLAEKSRLFLGDAVRSVQLCPGVRDLFAVFAEQGIAPYVVSSSSKANVEAMLHMHGLDLPSVHAADVKHGKPAPDMFLLALERARDEGNDGRALVLEDSLSGVRAGVAAGLDTYGVLTGGFPEQELVAAGARQVFPDAGGLAQALQRG
ncbi:MAG: HAD family phosphatase [Candidatus Undinarchaeales archaeon]|nr:HAD family phosphatase [Candidatus Undinarchaeales archaeon]MDP7493520.1 HAD family phosphatase [Candidatus Undinarchaeales archaeon]